MTKRLLQQGTRDALVAAGIVAGVAAITGAYFGLVNVGSACRRDGWNESPRLRASSGRA